jgi:hypothetical protein
MLFTWDTTDLCIVFRQWHISGAWSLIVSLIGVIALTAGYELVRELSRRWDVHMAQGGDARSEQVLISVASLLCSISLFPRSFDCCLPYP